MENLIIISSAISALATIAIAYYAFRAHNLTKEMRRTQENRDQEVSDLYQAIVIATLLSGPTASNIGSLTPTFEKLYNGKTKIF